MKRGTLLAFGLAVAGATSLEAQTCLGRASFGTGAARVGVAYRDARYGADVAYGSQRSVFVAAQGDTRRRDFGDYAYSSSRGGVTAGTQLDLGSTRLQLCPLVSFGLFRGSTDATDFQNDYSGRFYEFGGALGYSVGAVESWHLVPSVAVSYVHQNQSVTATSNGTTTRYSGLLNDSRWATFALGIGNNGLTATPFIRRSLGARYGTSQWGIGLTYNFGRR